MKTRATELSAKLAARPEAAAKTSGLPVEDFGRAAVGKAVAEVVETGSFTVGSVRPVKG